MQIVLVVIVLLSFSIGNAQSISKGSVSNGSLIKGVKIPYYSKNVKYFSILSYYVLGRAYVNHRVANTMKEAFKNLEKENYKYRIMECSKKHGGRMRPHRTHQNGLSIDIMTPLKKNENPYYLLNGTGIFHYLLAFDKNGVLNFNKNVEIDFDMMAKMILVMDDAAQNNGLKISKVILKINLKDDIFKTKYGKELKRRNIYFVRALPRAVDNVHDDHFHLDFKIIN